ncbi:hypothetical protein [Enterococcus sp. AZ109]|uniref:hypothetical protein n=1 Tax=Enterococcus sp. AZ109 TaxID=2774634 RepID=UPI003F21FF46
MSKQTKNLNLSGLALLITAYFIFLIASRLHIIPANINIYGLFGFAAVAIVLIISFIIVPTGEKKLFMRMGIGQGWGLNPRNVIGFLFYLVLMIVALIGAFA